MVHSQGEGKTLNNAEYVKNQVETAGRVTRREQLAPPTGLTVGGCLNASQDNLRLMHERLDVILARLHGRELDIKGPGVAGGGRLGPAGILQQSAELAMSIESALGKIAEIETLL